MKSLTIKNHFVSPFTGLFFHALNPQNFTALYRSKRHDAKGIAKRKDPREINNTYDEVHATSALSGLRRLLRKPTRSCNECLADISSDTERCPHCRALQNNEASRLRRRDAGWY
ncbi:MAG: hypothetical protein AB8B79_06780 [Granulosicoccus sp.]